MFELVLFEPRIPQNTGNIIRLCANTGARLHLIEPLGFTLDDSRVKRAGLDYHDMAVVTVHPDLAHARASLAPARWFACSARAATRHSDIQFSPGDVLMFGPEPTGLPERVLGDFDSAHSLRIPMVAGSRSLNLANAVSVVLFEAWRQIEFDGGS